LPDTAFASPGGGPGVTDFTAYLWLALTALVVVVIVMAYRRRPGPPS
jgi:hypothetical protein